MKKKILFIALALLIIINLSAFATLTYHRYCKSHEKCSYKKEYTKGNFLCQKLNLTNSQIIKMRELSCEFHEKADSISSVLCVKRTQLADLLSASFVDTNRIDLVLNKIDFLQAELQKQVVYYLLKEKESLNPEQQQKFIGLIKEKLVHNSKYQRASNFYLIEDSCSTSCQKLNNCPNNQ